ncbi:non-specific lipid-transfer protein C, cotyledon-specific isoform-like [Magnolia sinica]|uniref:non-specific lipid-transfer protein C, cotyledon-specific isoform-like n=1 Tax=Magnolia sinica TaxID=86752 RepID=UPI00265B3D1D|nr:non-specific lipid-transfer protein C, cotyledon-specific isoform-like [Magnolia sinica]
MKNLTASLFLILFIMAHVAHAAITCGEVDVKAASCVNFVTGKVTAVPAACCGGLQALVKKAVTVTDRRAICSCLKDGIKKFPGAKDQFLGKVPGACNIKVGFPVSLNTNCNSIN